MSDASGSVPSGLTLRPARRAVMMVFCLAATLGSPDGWAQSSCFIDRNGVRACPVGPEPGGGISPGGGRQRQSSNEEEAERAARNALIDRYNAKIGESDAAVSAGRYREAARLRRDAVNQRGVLGASDQSRMALQNAARYERYADSDDAAKAGDAAYSAGNYSLALAHYQRMIGNPDFDNAANRKVIADLQNRIQAAQERDARNRKVAETISKKIEEFSATLDTNDPHAGRLVSQAGTVGDGMGTRKANAPVLEFGDPNAPEAHALQARQGFDDGGHLKGSVAVPKVSAPTIGPGPTASKALHAQIPEKAKSDPLVSQSLAWVERLDSMRSEADTKTAAIKTQQKNGSGDAAALAAQLRTLDNERKRIDQDQAKATVTIQRRVKNLGLEWNEPTDSKTKGAVQ